MKADTVQLAQVFGLHTRYQVPLFQRPYVWQKDRQWQPLWDDILAVATRLTDESSTNDDLSHFMGAIVVDQEVHANGPSVRIVIDGQQRLTTLQLIIAAARSLSTRHGEAATTQKLESLLYIPSFLLADPADRLMVVPTNADRAAFAAAIEHEGKPPVPLPKGDSAHVLAAYRFFEAVIKEWVLDPADGDTPEVKLQALARTIWELLRLVVIALEPGDDAQTIFETMNARGTPLLAADLVKNYLFRQIEAASGTAAAEHAYHDQWSRFDKHYWREVVGQGRLRRPRIDILLTHWLTLRTSDEVSAQSVFEPFRAYAARRGAADILADLDETAGIYANFDEFDAHGIEGTFFHRLDVMQTTTMMPVVLWIFGPSGIGEPADRRRAIRALESWLVRRMLCRMTTKAYNTVALNLLKHLSAFTPTADEVVGFLVGLSTDSQLWPDDARVLEALRSLPYYEVLTRRRLRMVLDAVEARLHDSKVGPFTDRDRLTIEHVMPQKWDLHWPLPEGADDLAARIERDAAKHRLGNLALVTTALNSSLSNAPWISMSGSSKRTELSKYSQYLINKDVIDQAAWGEEQIAVRGEKLAQSILKIWPRG